MTEKKLENRLPIDIQEMTKIGDFLFQMRCNFLFNIKCIYELFILNDFGLKRRCETTQRLDGKVVVITGGNTGIGKETALQLSFRGAQIIIGCRDLVKAEEAVKDIRNKNPNAIIKVLHLDLSSLASVKQFAQLISEQEMKIDILINNAGVMRCPEWKTEDGFEMQFGTNYLGHFQLTHSLLHLLKKSTKARVINVSSICHMQGKINFDNINLVNGEYEPYKAYAQSKLAMVLWTKEMARRLGPDSNVNLYVLHPGIIQTELQRYFPEDVLKPIERHLITVELGAQTTLYCALEPALDKESGFYYSDCRRVDSMLSNAIDEKSARQLYDYTCQLIQMDRSLVL